MGGGGGGGSAEGSASEQRAGGVPDEGGRGGGEAPGAGAGMGAGEDGVGAGDVDGDAEPPGNSREQERQWLRAVACVLASAKARIEDAADRCNLEQLLAGRSRGPANEQALFLNQTVNDLGMTFGEWVANLVENGDIEGIETVLALIAPNLDDSRRDIIFQVLQSGGKLGQADLPPLDDRTVDIFDLVQASIDDILYDGDYAIDFSIGSEDDADEKADALLTWVVPLVSVLAVLGLAAAVLAGVLVWRRRADAGPVWWRPPGAGGSPSGGLLRAASDTSTIEQASLAMRRLSGRLADPPFPSDGKDAAIVAPLTVQQAARGLMKRSSDSGSVYPLPTGDGSVSLTPTHADASKRSASYIDQAELELYDTIGKGAFGVVFRGSWRGQEVAVKVLSLAFHEEAAHVRSFKKEVDVLSRVDHPHIVKLMGASLAPPDVCIVEELMPNGSLHDALHRRRWKPSYVEILTIVHDVAAALAYLHPRIVHCDLKPQNILLTLEDRAKVADFGIARIKRGTYIHGTTADVNGTPGYMAPELFSSGKVSEKCDVFSIGILLWVCYTGEEPWADFAFPMQVVMAVAVQHRRPDIPEDMPAPLVSLLHRCWKEEPHRRPSCAELQKQALLLIEEERMNPRYSTAPVLSSHPL